MSWTAQTLNDSLRRQEIYPLYLLCGDETFLIDETLARLEALVVSEGMRDFNYHSFYGEDADIARLRDAIETLPMMAPARLVVLKEAQALNDRDWEALLPLIENPIDSCVFVCVATKVDKRKKAIKRFFERGVAVEFKRPFDNQIPEWITYIANKHSLKIEPEAAALMQQLVGGNLSDLNGEMQKLAQFLGSRKTVEVDDVSRAVSRVRLDSVFELTDAIGGNDRARALDCLGNLLDHGQNEVGVLALISRHVRILRMINEGLKEGLSGQRLSARAGVSHFFLKQYVQQSRHWNESKIARTYQALLDTDRALKSSPVAAHIWLENFIIHTCAT